jgi:hypothetical protein
MQLHIIHIATSVSRILNTLYIKVSTRFSFKNATRQYVRVGILLICGKYFDDLIVSLIGDVRAHKTNLTQPFLITVHVPRQVNER